MDLTAQQTEQARDRVARLFRFLQELHRVRTPPCVHVDQYDWKLELDSLPKYPTITVGEAPKVADADSEGSPSSTDNDFIVKIQRPRETACPDLPASLKDWVKPGWKQIEARPEILQARNRVDKDGKTVTELVADDPNRQRDFDLWLASRKKWREAEAPAREALSVFSEFFELWGKFQRESERFQLYLGDGMLNWSHPNGDVKHPLLLLKVELKFDPSVPEFIVRETENASEFNSGLLRFYDVDGNGLQQCRQMVTQNAYHPLDDEKTSGFLRHVVQRFWQDGEYVDKQNGGANSVHPTVTRSPFLYLGDRNQGFTEAVDAFLEALPNFSELPESLVRLVGFETRSSALGNGEESGDSSQSAYFDGDVDLLLTKPANPEQERVIRRLHVAGSVLVQGPPGTGKSHTIANLIGHLLAEQKTILVASHTSKALKVVRDKVAKPIRPLCVSVLDNDEESRKQLEESIAGIVNYFSRTDKGKLLSEMQDLKGKRAQINERYNRLLESLTTGMREEYTDIVVAGEGTPPSQAARKLVDYAGIHDWIPGPVVEGASFPLSGTELAELYATNQIVGAEDEKILLSPIPDLEKVPTGDELTRCISELEGIERKGLACDPAAWDHLDHTPDRLAGILDKAMAAVAPLEEKTKWLLECIEAGRKGGAHREPWDSLIHQIELGRDEIAKRLEVVLAIGPRVEAVKPVKELIRICSEIIEHLQNGGKLGGLSTLFKSEWKEFVKAVEVDDGPPKTHEHFHAIRSSLEIEAFREDLRRRWERQMARLGATALPPSADKPEEVAFQFVEKMRYGLSWHRNTWLACESEFQVVGLKWEHLKKKIQPSPTPIGEILRIRDLVLNCLAKEIEARCLKLYSEVLNISYRKWITYLDSFSEKEASYPLVSAMRGFIENRDHVSYREAWKRLSELSRLKSTFHTRYELLKKMDANAPGWSAAIRNRRAPHDSATIPGDSEMAWRHRQWDQTISRRNQTDLDSIQRELNAVKDQLQDVTAQYVERLAWHAQADRTGLKEQQALNGWLGIQRRIGAGTGMRVPILRAEAKKVLKDCRGAVPVWIMPVSRVIENFDLAKTRFDVVILDEASQSDVLGLVAFAIGKEVVVVGDDEQVSPYAVGQQVMTVQALIDEFLKDIPNKQLYDGKASVYDLARQSFGGTIRLIEHFRCVPDIIQFSNFLCYNGEIRALREANDTRLYPNLIPYRVSDGVAVSKVNQVEAQTVASIIVAASEMAEYRDCSMGVISLVGIEQALFIDEILRRKLSLSEYQNRKILCGNASQFQGDERDVMFLSMVDSPQNGPLVLRQRDEYKKTFNVAASRARDQFWLIHSLNPDTDLKAGDLRLRLIRHVEDPTALRKQYETGEKRTDSEFERLVLSDLTAAGYRVVCQWEVGAFNIDMVVVGNEDRKVAIECDGDRYHPPEQLGKDLERQMILERLGWRFIRIRGSEFFRGRNNAIKRVIRRLSEVGIEPIGPKPSSGDEPGRTEELKARVIRRAEEIRKEWEANPEPVNTVPSRKRGWRTRTRSENPAGSSPAQPERKVQTESKNESEKKGDQTPLPFEPKASTERPHGLEEKVVGNGKREAAMPVGVGATDDETVLDQVCRILREAKRPLLAREIADKLAKLDITITKQRLNQILWNRNTRTELKHDDNFRWFLG